MCICSLHNDSAQMLWAELAFAFFTSDPAGTSNGYEGCLLSFQNTFLCCPTLSFVQCFSLDLEYVGGVGKTIGGGWCPNGETTESSDLHTTTPSEEGVWQQSDWFTRLIEYLCWQGRDIGCGDQFSGALKATAAWVDVELNYGRALKANGYVWSWSWR